MPGWQCDPLSQPHAILRLASSTRNHCKVSGQVPSLRKTCDEQVGECHTRSHKIQDRCRRGAALKYARTCSYRLLSAMCAYVLSSPYVLMAQQIDLIFLERQTLEEFMWQPDMLQVAKFLDAGVKRMQEIDPDAGSNI